MNFDEFKMQLLRWIKHLDRSTDIDCNTDLKAINIALMKEVQALLNAVNNVSHLEAFIEAHQRFTAEVKRNPYAEQLSITIDTSLVPGHLKSVHLGIVKSQTL